jgi:hypothetical protein
MQINWLQPTEIPGGIPVPTYGRYGGPNWSGGKVVGDDEPGNYTVPPEDALDRLFRRHDKAYDQPDTLLRAEADLLLIQRILAQDPDAVTGEGDLYAGGAVIAMLYQIVVVNKHPEVLIGADLDAILQGAVDRIEQGSITPEPREVAGFLAWLGTVGQALAASDSPIANAVADSVLDLAAALGSAPPAEFQEVLTDEAIRFLKDVAPQLADAAETVIGPPPVAVVEKLLDHASDWLGDVTPIPVPVAPLEVIATKFAPFADGDYFLL